MKVTCAIILTIVGFVSATPYGYGVKTGAAAKAEAGAISGGPPGLNGLPILIPSGVGYSGSFSKASSYASSSASASSSSFSFSGSGPEGGCSGGCPNNGDKTNYQHGNNPNSFGTANAGTYAGAVAGSANNVENKGPCLGNNCKNNNSKTCSSGECSTGTLESNDISAEKTKPGYSVTECAEGNCEQAPTVSTENAYTNHQNKGPEPTAPAYASSDSYLTTPNLAPSNKPSSYNVPIQSVYEPLPSNDKSSTCTYGNCGNKDSPSSDTSKQYLETNINQNKPCSTPGCGSHKPSTYLEAPAINNKPTCAGDSCGYNYSPAPNDIGPIPSFVPLHESNKVTTGFVPSYSSPTVHHKPSYGIAPVTQLTGPYGLAPTSSPTHSGSYAPTLPSASACSPGKTCGGYQPAVVPSSVPTCTTPGCKSAATTSSASASADTEKLPTYTGSFGGPPGILKPFEYSIPPNIHNKPSLGSNTGNYKPSSLPCFLENCNSPGQPNSPSSGYKPTGPLTYPSGPPSAPSGSYKPDTPVKYPSGQPAAPSGSYKPTGPVSYPSGPPSAPSGSYEPAAPVKYPSGQPAAPSGSYKPTGPISYPSGPPSAPSGSYKPDAPVKYPSGQPAAPSGSYKPTGPVSYPSGPPSAPSSGSYKPDAPVKYPSGQPAAPSGSYKPTGPISYPSEAPTNPTGGYKPIGPSPFPIGQPIAPSHYKPGSSYNPSYQPTGPTEQPIGPSGSYHPVAPGSYQPTAPNQTPCFYGNCDQKPASNYPSSGSYKPIGQDNSSPCSSGECGPPKPLTPAYVPSIPSESYKPTGSSQIPCFLGNCNNDHTNHKPTTTNDVQCSSGNCNQGSATGPTGSSVPFYEIPKPSGSYKPSGPSLTPCSAGNCNSVTNNAGSTSQAGYSPVKVPGGHKPSGPEACLSGNCNQAGHTGAASTAGASAQAGTYTGGFGGPPGLLTPYDGKVPFQNEKQISHPHSVDHLGSYDANQAGASTNTGAGSYGVEGGESGNGKHSGCNSGCGGGGYKSAAGGYASAGAGAVASAKSYAHSGAFASSSASAHAGAQVKSGYGR